MSANGDETDSRGKIIASFQTPAGDIIRKWERPDGSVEYRRANTSSSEKGAGTFVSKQVGESIEERAAGDTGSDRNVQFVVRPQTQETKQEALTQRYPEINNVQNLDPNTVRARDSQETNSIKGWMNNESLREDIESDPLLDNRSERRAALEARARQIVNDLQNAENEQQAIQILNQYGVAS